jgi:hypothetical protein
MNREQVDNNSTNQARTRTSRKIFAVVPPSFHFRRRCTLTRQVGTQATDKNRMMNRKERKEHKRNSLRSLRLKPLRLLPLCDHMVAVDEHRLRA